MCSECSECKECTQLFREKHIPFKRVRVREHTARGLRVVAYYPKGDTRLLYGIKEIKGFFSQNPARKNHLPPLDPDAREPTPGTTESGWPD